MSGDLKVLLWIGAIGVLLFAAATPFLVRLGISGSSILPFCGGTF